MTLLETIRYAASRKSSLDRDQKLLTDAAAELERLTGQLAEARAMMTELLDALDDEHLEDEDGTIRRIEAAHSAAMGTDND